MNCFKCATPLPADSRFCLSCGADVSGEGHSHERTLAVDDDPQLMLKLQADLGDDYVLEKELGRGGMAAVFLGHDAHLGRKVAVKVLPPELTFGTGQAMVERFKREARTSATLDHPNIIPVYRVSTTGKLSWYVMKYLEGESLDRILEREGQLPVERVAAIIAQAAAALDYAHEHQVIHRDVKPANLMIDAKDRVMVTDFGIAKALDAATLTATGSMIGTPYYMSPEQCSGKRVGPASDQYSLAVMAYQMLSGLLPFTGESIIDIVRKQCMDPPPPLSVLRPQLPNTIIEVVERGLAKAPLDRYATCADFGRALQAAAEGKAVPAVTPQGSGLGRGSATPPRISKTALVSPLPGALRTAKGTWRDRPGRIAALIAVLGVTGAGVVFLPGMLQRDSAAASGQTAAATPASQPDSNPVQPAAGGDSTALSASETSATTSAVPAPARLTLNGVPRGATVRRDGQRVTGTSFALDAGRSYTFEVTAAGFDPWRQTIRLDPGETASRAVRLQATAGQTLAAAPETAPARQPEPQPVSPQPAPAAEQATITVGSNPAGAQLLINGRPAPSNPVADYPVPAGAVRLRFIVTDAAGPWTFDTTITARPGANRVGRIQLRRP